MDGTTYTLKVEFCEGGSELFVNDATEKDKHVLTCRINMKHPYFENIDEKKSACSIVMIKSMAIAKFVSLMNEDDTIEGFFRLFNDYIMKVQN